MRWWGEGRGMYRKGGKWRGNVGIKVKDGCMGMTVSVGGWRTGLRLWVGVLS